jgi:exosortase A
MKKELMQLTFSGQGTYPAKLFLLLLGGAFLAAFYPVWASLVNVWANSDDYSHGFAILPLVGYILWGKRHSLRAAVGRGSAVGLALAVIALLLYLLARIGEILTLAPLAMVLFLAGAVLYLFGAAMLRECAFPLLLLFFMIPLPAQIYSALTLPLQLLVTRIAVELISWGGVPVLCDGNIIHLPAMSFQVVEACSGLRSLTSLLLLGAVLSYFTLRSRLLRLLLFSAALPVAILVNIVRVMALPLASYFFNLDLTEGIPHTLLGMGAFVLALGLLLLLQKGLVRCEH